MELSEAMPFLAANSMAVVTTVDSRGRSQATVVSAGPVGDAIAFVSRERTAKVRNVRRNGRCAVTAIKGDTRRYVTIEGPATAHGWGDTDEATLLQMLRNAYSAAGRPPESWDDFDATMREEQRTVVLVTPERVYGSLERSR